MIFRLFIEGGTLWNTVMTLEFIALFLAAWKAPAWVKEIGLLALMTGIFGTVAGIFGAAESIQAAGGAAQHLIWGGVRVALITSLYGIVIYIVSLVIRIVQKPRLL